MKRLVSIGGLMLAKVGSNRRRHGMKMYPVGTVVAGLLVVVTGCDTVRSNDPTAAGFRTSQQVSSAATAATRGSNLVVNGDMETVTVAGWWPNMPEGARCEILSVDDPVRAGRHALVLRSKGTWMSANSCHVTIDPAKRYSASAWVRSKDGQAYIQIDHHGNGKWLGPSRGTQRVVSDVWTEVSVESDFSRYPGTTYLSVAIVCDGPDVEVYVDNVALRALDSAE